MAVEVANDSGVEVDELALLALARHVLDQMRVHPQAELSLMLVDTAEMAVLHEKWMGEAGPTDVMAFPMDELSPGTRVEPPGEDGDAAAPSMLGDVVLCPEIARKQAREHGHSAAAELELLCTHGVLHLLGYDHAEPAEHKEMFDLQERLLASWRAAR